MQAKEYSRFVMTDEDFELVSQPNEKDEETE